MNKTITVIAVSVDTQRVTLFTPDGSNVSMEQGDPRVTHIMKAVKGPLSEVPPRPVEVSLEVPKAIHDNPEFAEAEKASGGIVRFFKIAKKHIADWFKEEDKPSETEPEPAAFVAPQVLGVVPGTEVQPTEPERKPVITNLANTLKAVAESKKVSVDPVDAVNGTVQAAPAKPAPQTNEQKIAEANARLDILESKGVKPSDPKFKQELEDDETVVAVTNNGQTIIPEAQHLQSQLKAASELKDFVGFQKFLERLGTVVKKRRFSVEDLMKFMKHGDLPIADDGSLVIYKRLIKKGKDKAGRDTYVDVASKNVIQRIGSRVFMAESMVDPDRRADCSNGLHVAAVSYLSSFSGDITIIGKVAPEDVIAVPEYNNNKMRVSAYDVLEVLTPTQAQKVNSGGKLTSAPGGAELLNAILRGKHVVIDQTVEIGGSYGTKLTIKDLDVDQAEVEELKPEDIRNKNLDVILDDNAAPPPSEPVTPTDLKPVAKAATKAEVVKKETIPETAQRLWAEYQSAPSAERLEMLVVFKKQSKRSWTKLGISDAAAELIEVEFAKLPTKTPTKTVGDFSELDSPARSLSARARIKAVFDSGKLTVESAEEILLIKKEAKKGWTALGVTDAQVDQVEKLTK